MDLRKAGRYWTVTKKYSGECEAWFAESESEFHEVLRFPGDRWIFRSNLLETDVPNRIHERIISEFALTVEMEEKKPSEANYEREFQEGSEGQTVAHVVDFQV